MKIGILTQPLFSNYGGILQNYALQKVLKDNGHETITLDWEVPQISMLHKLAIYVKVFLLNTIFGKKYRLPYWPTSSETETIESQTCKFIDDHIVRTKKITHKAGFLAAANNEKINAFVVGSDQVWRLDYNIHFLTSMFLDFTQEKDVKRIAYAASFGTDSWSYSDEMTDLCKSYASRFDLITVREDTGVKLCKEHLGVDATHVLDPTMLLNVSDYESLVTQDRVGKSDGNLFYYILDPSDEKCDFITKVAKITDYKPFTIMPKYQAENRTRRNIKNEIDKCVFPPVTLWLRAFMDAKMVICDSFHGCVFSIIFHKPFWIIGNKTRGNTRFDSLLKTFNLQNRLISVNSHVDFNEQINWNEVESIRLRKSNESIDLLLKVLCE